MHSSTADCYDPKLGSGCNLGKDLSKSRGDDQLVKHKDTGLYLQLYIPNDHDVRLTNFRPKFLLIFLSFYFSLILFSVLLVSILRIGGKSVA